MKKAFLLGKLKNTNDEKFPLWDTVKIIKKVNKTMGQLSLFSAEEFYDFPKDLLEFREHFLTPEESDRLFSQLLKILLGNRELKPYMTKRY